MGTDDSAERVPPAVVRCQEALTTTDAVRLVELARDQSEWVRASVPLNPLAPRQLLRDCLSDRSWRVVAAVAARMAPHPRFWDEAAPLSDEVSAWLATCGELGEEWALRLADHEDSPVREALASSTPWLSAQARLCRDRARDVRASLAGSLVLLPQIRRVLVEDPDEDVRELAERRWVGVVDDGSSDPDWVTEEDLFGEALAQPGVGAAAAVQRAAVVAHDRETDAGRHRIWTVQAELPWTAGAP